MNAAPPLNCCPRSQPAGLTDARVRAPDALLLPLAFQEMVAFVEAHTVPGTAPLLVAHNGKGVRLLVLQSMLVLCPLL